MSKRSHTSKPAAGSSSSREVADLEARAIGVRMVKKGDRYHVYKDDVVIGQVWRNPFGAWGYTTNDGRDGFVHLSAGSARDALLRRHLKRAAKSARKS